MRPIRSIWGLRFGTKKHIFCGFWMTEWELQHFTVQKELLRWSLQFNPAMIRFPCTTSCCPGCADHPWNTCWPLWTPAVQPARNGVPSSVRLAMRGVTWPSPWESCCWKWRNSALPKPSFWSGALDWHICWGLKLWTGTEVSENRIQRCRGIAPNRSETEAHAWADAQLRSHRFGPGCHRCFGAVDRFPPKLRSYTNSVVQLIWLALPPAQN